MLSTTASAVPHCQLFAVCLSGDYTFGCAATAHCSGGGAVSCTVGHAASFVRECPSVGCNTPSTDLPHRLLRLPQLQQLRHQLRSPSNRRQFHLRRHLTLRHRPHLQLPLPLWTDAWCAVGYTTNVAIVHAVSCTFGSFICGAVYRTVSRANSCIISRAVSRTVRSAMCSSICRTIGYVFCRTVCISERRVVSWPISFAFWCAIVCAVDDAVGQSSRRRKSSRKR